MHGENTRDGASRLVVALAVSGLLVVVACVSSLVVGARPVAPLDALRAVFGGDVDPLDHAAIWDGRLPRTVLGLVAGAALGVAGALVQGLTRNPLADPGVLGVNAGAAFAIVLAVGLLGVGSVSGLVWFALAGALASTVAVYAIGSGGLRGRRGGLDPVRLTLAGVALGAVLTGIGSGLSLLYPHAFDRLRAWNVGSLDVRSLEPTVVVLPFVAAGLLLAAGLARGVDAIALGDDMAHALGTNVTVVRMLGLLALTLLAGAATAAAGAIGFLGLLAPHLARRIVGPDQRRIMLLCVLLGPAVLLLADVLGRVVVPGEMAVGVVTALVGAPVLVAIALRRKVIEL